MKIYMWSMAFIFSLSIVGQVYRFVSGNLQKTRKEVAMDLIFGIVFLIWTVIMLAIN